MSDTNERSVASAGSVAGGNDLIDRLSDLSGDVGRWGGRTIGEAIAEIERLRLTDAEREAVERAVATADDYHDDSVAATLRGLLERTKGGER